MIHDFLPVCRADMEKRGWDQCDFVYVCGDAYVDHPSFGSAIISRVLESYGYKVGIIAQPDWKDKESVQVLGRPRLGFLVSAGNMDSMVNHYSVSKRRRDKDSYTPGGVMGKRPDYAAVVYCNLIRSVYKDIPIVIGGIEASLRRLAHYDYWSNKVKHSILVDSQADLISYGMGEKSIVEIADALNSGLDVKDITFIDGTVYKTDSLDSVYDAVTLPSYDEIKTDKRRYAESFNIQYKNTDAFSGKRLVEQYRDNLYVVQNPPAKPLSVQEMDDVYALPYMRRWHPSYDAAGGIPAFSEVKFSLISNRGCFGGCSFCALTFHQGRIVQARSHDSLVEEARAITDDPDFKGYIHDVGGPAATFRRPSCQKQLKHGMCKNRSCLAPEACPNLDADHTDYMMLLRKVRALPGIKKVFIRSGIRFDFLMKDPSGEFFTDLVQYHISGQLKVAPEHCVDHTLDYMGKPHVEVYEKFRDKYYKLNRRYGKDQYLVPYLISSHPGCTLEDAVQLAEWLNKEGHMPEQVQDFYPTPGTLATCMWYTGIDPRTMQPVFVPKTPHDKALQRALMQWRKPQNRALVLEALHKTGREDLIGYGKHCLIRPGKGPGADRYGHGQDQRQNAQHSNDRRPGQKSGQSGRYGKPGKPDQNARPGQNGKYAKGPQGGRPAQGKPDGRHAVSRPTAQKPVKKASWAKAKPSKKPGKKKG